MKEASRMTAAAMPAAHTSQRFRAQNPVGLDVNAIGHLFAQLMYHRKPASIPRESVIG
jgi:hypothetical protein